MLVIAHRGASRACRENTVAAFREAKRLGADMVELDARRVPGRPGAVAVRHDPLPEGPLPDDVPLLADAVDACDGMGVNVEIKNLPTEPDFDPAEWLAEAVAAFVAEHDLFDRVLVSSFSLATIDRVRRVDPRVRTAWLTLAGYDPQTVVDTCLAGGHVAVHPHERAVTPALVESAHRAGLLVNTWTVDDPDRMAQLVADGVDGICTNVPDVAVGVLERLRAGP